jgi:hypothetical protein
LDRFARESCDRLHPSLTIADVQERRREKASLMTVRLALAAVLEYGGRVRERMTYDMLTSESGIDQP